jgi:predicted AlkP superfamily pyrophosphatase or phosphodiesterase
MKIIKNWSIVVMSIFVFGQTMFAQKAEKPKLIVGVVIDQMRAEYLYRFQDNYIVSGFKRLIKERFNVKNTHYNYIPTATGPGYTSIYNGATPANHGIVGNDWYDKVLRRKVYCAEDSTVLLVDNKGIDKSKKIIRLEDPLKII